MYQFIDDLSEWKIFVQTAKNVLYKRSCFCTKRSGLPWFRCESYGESAKNIALYFSE